MADIYLTKVERKTIFTKAIIFVIILFVISDLTVTGPFFFNFLPWIYILGIIGQVKRIDKPLITIICCFTIFTSSIICEKALNVSVIINTAVAAFMLLLGFVVGKLIYEFVLEKRLVKYIKIRTKILYIFLIILCTIISFATLFITSGSLFEYLEAKNDLKEYIARTYNEEYKIKEVIFNNSVQGRYVFKVNIDNHLVTFIKASKNNFRDIDRNERKEKESKLFNENLQSVLKQIDLTKYSSLKNIYVNGECEYTKIEIVPEQKIIYISLNEKDYNYDLIFEQIASYLKEIISRIEMDKVVININAESIEVQKENLNEVTTEYISSAFSIEKVDELRRKLKCKKIN